MNRKTVFSRVGFWFGSTFCNVLALVIGVWGGGRMGRMVYSIVFAGIFDTSHINRGSLNLATTAGLIASVIVLTLTCMAALGVAQWWIWNERNEPELALWSIIGVALLPVGIVCGILAAKLIYPLISLTRINAEYLCLALCGMLIGIIRWLVLRHHVSLVWTSILANMVALPVGVLAFQGKLENHIWLLLVILTTLYFAIADLPLIWISPKKD